MTNSTTFVPQTTPITSAWLNDINQMAYQNFPHVNQFGADPTGVADSGAAFRAAVAAVSAMPFSNGGAGIRMGPGLYKISADPTDTSNTGCFIPSGVTLYGSGMKSTTLIPGANNTNIFRVTGSYGGFHDVSFTNPSSFTGCRAIRLAPTDESNTTTLSVINFNRISHFHITGPFDESFTMRPGPNVSGTDSEMYYNTISQFDILGTTRGVWLKAPPNTGGGANANTFSCGRAGQSGMNTGWQIDQGSENNFVDCAGEGVTTGSSPNASPTAIFVATGAGANTANNNFIRFRSEGNTTSWNLNSNTTTTLIMTADSGLTAGTAFTYVAPSSGVGYATTGYVGVGTSSPTFEHQLDVVLPANGFGVSIADGGSNSNQFFHTSLSTSGGVAFSYIDFLVGGTSQVLTWGGASTSYAGILRLNNPVNNILVLGVNNADKWEIDTSGHWLAVNNGSQNIGSASHQIQNIYLVNAPIVSSDANLKQQVSPIDSRALAAWSKISYSQYKLNAAVELKGSAARIHIGLIAQSIQSAFESEGLDAFEYGLLCKDTIDGEDQLSVRYEEALALECAYLRSQLTKG